MFHSLVALKRDDQLPKNEQQIPSRAAQMRRDRLLVIFYHIELAALLVAQYCKTHRTFDFFIKRRVLENTFPP
jgi:hypothetical protein